MPCPHVMSRSGWKDNFFLSESPSRNISLNRTAELSPWRFERISPKTTDSVCLLKASRCLESNGLRGYCPPRQRIFLDEEMIWLSFLNSASGSVKIDEFSWTTLGCRKWIFGRVRGRVVQRVGSLNVRALVEGGWPTTTRHWQSGWQSNPDLV